MTYYSEIEDAEQNLENLKRQYLQRWGWDYTCSIPGAFWMWRRDFSDIDAKRLEWWVQHTTPKQREKDFGPGMPSKPTPYGVITADTDMALAITVRDLDEQPEAEPIEG